MTVSTTDGYPQKEAIPVTSFSPKNYGALIAMLMTDEQGNLKNITKVDLICNPIDYVTKIMPASTTIASDGNYVNNVFPFPTDVTTVSRGLEQGNAILGVLKDYKGLLGSKKGGVLDYSDDAQFIEDIRVYTAKAHAAGRAVDNNSFILLDISELEEHPRLRGEDPS